METIDSKEKQLSIPEVVVRAATNSSSGLPLQTILVAFAKEASMPNTDVDLYGNTVFITHYDKTKTKAVGRALNADVAKNFIFSGQEYLRDMYKRGVRRWSTWFRQPSYAMGFKFFRNHPITTEMDVQILPEQDGKTIVLIKLDGELI